MNLDSEKIKKYGRTKETGKLIKVLAMPPHEAALIAAEHPGNWGFDDRIYYKYKSSPEMWLEEAQKEHQGAVSFLEKDKDVEVINLKHSLKQKEDECREYLKGEFEWIKTNFDKLELDKKMKDIIDNSKDEMLDSPVDSLLLGLEASKLFKELPYEERLNAYRHLQRLMPQTSIHFTRDGVIVSKSERLIEPEMAMLVRRQEPAIMKIALGKENYHDCPVNHEGGDVIMGSYVHGGDIIYTDGVMLLGINSLSGKVTAGKLKKLAELAELNYMVTFFMPDISDPKKRYITENVSHLDTVLMPCSDHEVAGNTGRLKEIIVKEFDEIVKFGEKYGDNADIVDILKYGRNTTAYEWVKNQKHFERRIEVPDSEQGELGPNFLDLGNREILSSGRLKETNKNLIEAGFTVYVIKSKAIGYGLGDWHCTFQDLMRR
jgi:arginine deiminase